MTLLEALITSHVRILLDLHMLENVSFSFDNRFHKYHIPVEKYHMTLLSHILN